MRTKIRRGKRVWVYEKGSDFCEGGKLNDREE